MTLATSGEFLRLCWSVGMVKVGVNLLLQFSNFSFDRLPPASELSVRGELCIANHKKEEEEEERCGGKLVRREPVLSRLNGLTLAPTMNQVGKTPHMMGFHQNAKYATAKLERHMCCSMQTPKIQMPPLNTDRRGNRNDMAKKSIKLIGDDIVPKYDIRFPKIHHCNMSNCLQVDAFSNGTSSTIRC